MVVKRAAEPPRCKMRDPKLAANWVINELIGRPQQGRQGHHRLAPVPPTQLGVNPRSDSEGTISAKSAKDVFDSSLSDGGEDPRTIVEQRGLKQVTDLSALEKDRRRHRRKERRQGRRRQSEPESDRLVRRPGDEGVGRQGQSAGGQRSPQEEDRHLSGAACRRRRRVRANASHAPRKSKRNRNPPRNVAARGRQTWRRRESLGTDSRVLRLIRLFDTPQNAFRAKFFLRCEVGCAGVVVREEICRKRSRSRRVFASQ